MAQAPLWTGNICSHALRPEGAWVGEIHVRIPSLRDTPVRVSPLERQYLHICTFASVLALN